MKKKNTLKNTTNRSTYKRIKTYICPYWDEGVRFYEPKGIKNYSKAKRRKELYTYEYRKYRTWKYNRKKQYKQK